MRSLVCSILLGCAASAESPDPVSPRTDKQPFLPVENDGGVLEVVFDATQTITGRIHVSETYRSIHTKPPLYFKEMGADPEYRYVDVKAFAPDGTELELEKRGPKYTVRGFEGDEVRLEYDVVPGGVGRHGHQGFVAAGWATFDGRAVLQPTGAMGLSEIRMRYEVPEGWGVYTPWRDMGDGWWSADPFPDRVQFEALQTSCVALGEFDTDVRTYGDTEVRVVAHRGFGEDHLKVVFDKSHRMADWFHRTVRFDPGFPVMFAFVPKPTKNRVFGGAWSNGACYEQPRDRERNWELMGHRFAHPINKYNPSGMYIRDHRDHWFMEGWASYIELVATASTGISPADQRHFTRMYRGYVDQRTKFANRDFVLADEAKAPSFAVGEFLHYSKGPLVVKMLDVEMRRRSGKNMEEFFAMLQAKYGGLSGAIPLREEVAAFTGVDFSDFWQAHVDRAGAVVPTWPAYERTRSDAELRAQEPPVAMVGGRAIHPDFLHFLTMSGQFDRFAEIERWLEDAVLRRMELERRGVRLWPEWMMALEHGLEPSVQWNIMEAELARDLPPLAPPSASGCGGGEAVALTLDRPTFELEAAHPTSRTWRTLLESEERYDAARAHTGLDWVAAMRPFKSKDPPRSLLLGFGDEETVNVLSNWLVPPDVVGVHLRTESTVIEQREVIVEPGWRRVWVTFDSDKRPRGEHLLYASIVADGETIGERVFWQRPLPVRVD